MLWRAWTTSQDRPGQRTKLRSAGIEDGSGFLRNREGERKGRRSRNQSWCWTAKTSCTCSRPAASKNGNRVINCLVRLDPKPYSHLSTTTFASHRLFHCLLATMVSTFHPIDRTGGALTTWQQPLAIDLLNPSQKSEEQRHKLKRLVQSPNSYFMDVKCPGMSYFIIFWTRYVFTMADASRLFCDYYRFLACPDSRFVWRLLERLVPTNWWKGEINRGSVIPVLQNHTGSLHVPTGSSYRRKN